MAQGGNIRGANGHQVRASKRFAQRRYIKLAFSVLGRHHLDGVEQVANLRRGARKLREILPRYFAYTRAAEAPATQDHHDPPPCGPVWLRELMPATGETGANWV